MLRQALAPRGHQGRPYIIGRSWAAASWRRRSGSSGMIGILTTKTRTGRSYAHCFALRGASVGAFLSETCGLSTPKLCVDRRVRDFPPPPRSHLACRPFFFARPFFSWARARRAASLPPLGIKMRSAALALFRRPQPSRLPWTEPALMAPGALAAPSAHLPSTTRLLFQAAASSLKLFQTLSVPRKRARL